MEITDQKFVIDIDAPRGGAAFKFESKTKTFYITSEVALDIHGFKPANNPLSNISADDFCKMDGEIIDFSFQTRDGLYNYVRGKVSAKIVDGIRHLNIKTED